MGLLYSRSQRRFEMSVNVCPDDTFWITKHFVTKFGMVMQHHEPESCRYFFVVAIFKVKVTARVHMINIWLFLLCYLNCWFLGNQTWSDDTSSGARVSYKNKNKFYYCIQGQGHSKEPKFNVRSDDIFQTNINVFSRWYLLNHHTFCFQTWYCDSSLWVRVSCRKIDSLFFKVKVTTSTHMIKIWQFLLYLLNCWSFVW